MVTTKYAILLGILVLVACDEHLRKNQFDLTSEDFLAPPPCDAFIYEVVSDSETGLITGITFAVLFADSLVQDFYLVHILNHNDVDVWRYGFSVEPGYEFYGFELRYGDYRPLPTGTYWFDVFWGEICIAACGFQIIVENNRAVLKTDLRRELIRQVSSDSLPLVGY